MARSWVVLTGLVALGGAPAAAQGGGATTFRTGIWAHVQSAGLYSIAPGVSWRPGSTGHRRIGLFVELGITAVRTTYDVTSVVGEASVGVARAYGRVRPELQVGVHCWSGVTRLGDCLVVAAPQAAVVWQNDRADGSLRFLRGVGIRLLPLVSGAGRGFVPYWGAAAFLEIAL